MKLDFSAMYPDEKNGVNFEIAGGGDTSTRGSTQDTKKQANNGNDALSVPRLEQIKRREVAEREAGAAVWKFFQEGIVKTERIQTETIKGIQEGENPYVLLKKLAEAVSILTGNEAFSKQVSALVANVRCDVLEEPDAIKAELVATEERIAKMWEKYAREERTNTREGIMNAIRANEAKKVRLKERIDEIG